MAGSSGNDQVLNGKARDPQESINPFENSKINSYNHKPNIVPPYVLDTLSRVHFKEQLNNSNVNTQEPPTYGKSNDEEQYLSFANDPYVKSMNNNWHNFINSVRQPTAYTDDRMELATGFDDDTKLEGTWGGEERLKLALLGTPSTEAYHHTEEKVGFFKRVFLGTPSVSKMVAESESPRIRSKAGYWMSDAKRKDVFPSLKRIFVQNPLVPLLLRILIIIFLLCALALACSIFNFSQRRYEGSKVEQQPSTIMAIVVQCFAISYVVYIAYDEYSGKPLGLRDPLGKMKLIMLDLLFIIFSSANLSLTFNTLYDDEWVCTSHSSPQDQNSGVFYPTVHTICRRQRALASLLFVVLCLWVLTFTISIIRVVDRVSTADPRLD